MNFGSVPAYSMSGRLKYVRVTSDMTVPGPGSYDPKQQLSPINNSPSFARSERAALFNPSLSPGPGYYSPTLPLSPKPRTPRKSLVNPSAKPKVISPGPCSYSPKSPSPAISYTIGNKIPETGSSNTIGPGHYSPREDLLQRSRLISFGKDQRFKDEQLLDVPGPGAYDVEGIKEPGFRFSKSLRNVSKYCESPGPGKYEISRDIGGSFKSMTQRREPIKQNNEYPGPGAYNILSTHNSSPAFSIGGALRPSIVEPNISNSVNNNLKKKPSSPPKVEIKSLSIGVSEVLEAPKIEKKVKNCGFGSGKRPELFEKTTSPGPGSYNLPNSIGEGPKHMMLGRKFERISMEVPGPAYYSPKNSSIFAVEGSRKFAKSKRWRDTKDNSVPGPGSYHAKGLFNNAPAWSFLKDPRVKEPEFDEPEPGPGHYELPICIPDVPKYLFCSSIERERGS